MDLIPLSLLVPHSLNIHCSAHQLLLGSSWRLLQLRQTFTSTRAASNAETAKLRVCTCRACGLVYDAGDIDGPGEGGADANMDLESSIPGEWRGHPISHLLLRAPRALPRRDKISRRTSSPPSPVSGGANQFPTSSFVPQARCPNGTGACGVARLLALIVALPTESWGGALLHLATREIPLCTSSVVDTRRSGAPTIMLGVPRRGCRNAIETLWDGRQRSGPWRPCQPPPWIRICDSGING